MDLRGDRRVLLSLCGELEETAAALPQQPDRLACLRLASEMVPILRRSRRLVEEITARGFVHGAGVADPTGELDAGYIENEELGLALTERLLDIGRGGRPGDWKALGPLVEAFSSGLRAHVVLVKSLLLPPPGGDGSAARH